MQQEIDLMNEIQQLAQDENVFGEGFNKEDLQRQLKCFSGLDINMNQSQ